MVFLAEEGDAAARGDIVAWTSGGLIWGIVTSALGAGPAGMLLGATLAFLLRRLLRAVVIF